jgi:hypothetical protein
MWGVVSLRDCRQLDLRLLDLSPTFATARAVVDTWGRLPPVNSLCAMSEPLRRREDDLEVNFCLNFFIAVNISFSFQQ